MRKSIKKENIMPIVVLVAISLVVALLLGVVNLITAPEIERRKQAAIDAAFKDVLPDGSNFNPVTLTEDYPKEVKGAHKGDGGYVFQLDVVGKEAMTLMIGIDSDGKVVGIKVVEESETPGYKDKVFPEVTGTDGAYSGMTKDTFEEVLVSGATLTSKGVSSAVKAALNAFAVANGGTVDDDEPEEALPREESEIIARAEALLGVAAGALTDVTPDGNYTNLKRVYRSADKKSYVFYTLVISQYGTPETETLVHVDFTGKVIAIDKLLLKTSDPADYGGGIKYDPPSADEIAAFYKRFENATADTIDAIAPMTGSTNTSTSLKNAVKEGIEAVEALIRADMPTPEADVIARAEALLGVAAGTLTDVTPDGNYTNLKRVYRSADKKSYVFYTLVISQYGTPETETLVHVDFTGKVIAIDKLLLKTSDPADYGGGVKYDPPSAEEIAAFYKRFENATADTIDAIAPMTGSTNTSTSLKNAVKEGIEAVVALIRADMPTPEADVIARAEALLGVAAGTLTDVTPAGLTNVKRIYCDQSKKNYVVYTVAISPNYGTPETETLVHIGSNGKIKAIEKLLWKTSDALWGYEPPTQEQADEFYAKLVGKDATYLASLKLEENKGELVTNATSTSGRLVDALIEALDNVPTSAAAPKIIAIVVMISAILGFTAYIAVPKILARRKRG